MDFSPSSFWAASCSSAAVCWVGPSPSRSGMGDPSSYDMHLKLLMLGDTGVGKTRGSGALSLPSGRWFDVRVVWCGWLHGRRTPWGESTRDAADPHESAARGTGVCFCGTRSTRSVRRSSRRSASILRSRRSTSTACGCVTRRLEDDAVALPPGAEATRRASAS